MNVILQRGGCAVLLLFSVLFQQLSHLLQTFFVAFYKNGLIESGFHQRDGFRQLVSFYTDQGELMVVPDNFRINSDRFSERFFSEFIIPLWHLADEGVFHHSPEPSDRGGFTIVT